MEWIGPEYNDSPTYSYQQNLAKTPYINIERSVLLTYNLRLEFIVEYPYLIRSGTGLRLDVYRTSSLGLFMSKLATNSDVGVASVKLCLPTGRFQLAFLACYDLCCGVSSTMMLSALLLTETECAVPTQTGRLTVSEIKSRDNILIYVRMHEISLKQLYITLQLKLIRDAFKKYAIHARLLNIDISVE